MQVLVTYNAPDTQGEYHLCHQGVLDEVYDVTKALQELGYPSSTLAVGHSIREDLVKIAYTNADCIFNLCESIGEKSGLVAAFAGYLELLSVPFTGSRSSALSIATDKRLTKAVLQQHSVRTPETWSGSALLAAANQQVEYPHLPFPVIVKPTYEDGSIGIEQSSVALGWSELTAGLHCTRSRFGDAGVLVERYISGREFTVAFLGNSEPVVLPLSELTFATAKPGQHNILSYQMKWVNDSSERKAFRRICPASLPKLMGEQIISSCRAAYLATGLAGYGRIDVRWETATDTAYVIDVNANPDITNGQGLPFMAAIAGVPYPQLLDEIIKYAFDTTSHLSEPTAVSCESAEETATPA